MKKIWEDAKAITEDEIKWYDSTREFARQVMRLCVEYAERRILIDTEDVGLEKNDPWQSLYNQIKEE